MLITPPPSFFSSLDGSAPSISSTSLSASHAVFECLNTLRGPANAIRLCRHSHMGVRVGLQLSIVGVYMYVCVRTM